MDNTFKINENTNIKNDSCFYDYENRTNELIHKYNFLPSLPDKKTNNRKIYIDSSKTLGLLQTDNKDIFGKNIFESTKLRNGSISSNQSKRELDTRVFPGAPLMSNGQSVLKNPDLSSRLKFGEDTRSKKSQNCTGSYSADNFIPLVPAIAENIQNVDHIIPTYWVRGGMSSRSVIRNIDYLKSCGFRK
jgi:hypothetical protein